MFFIGVASGVVFITVFFLLIANRSQPKKSPEWVERQYAYLSHHTDILAERNLYEARIANALEDIAKSAIPGAAGKSVQQPSCEKDGTNIIEPSSSQD